MRKSLATNQTSLLPYLFWVSASFTTMVSNGLLKLVYQQFATWLTVSLVHSYQQLILQQSTINMAIKDDTFISFFKQ